MPGRGEGVAPLVMPSIYPCLGWLPWVAAWLPWVHCCRSSLFLCVHLPPCMYCRPALSDQTLQFHREYLNEQMVHDIQEMQ